VIAAGRCVDCRAELGGSVTVGRCSACRVARLPDGLREVAEGRTPEPRCATCGCPERLHAPLAPWCAGCGAPCPPAEPAPPTDDKQERVLAALVRYAERHR
jgi:hypothetical protein